MLVIKLNLTYLINIFILLNSYVIYNLPYEITIIFLNNASTICELSCFWLYMDELYGQWAKSVDWVCYIFCVQVYSFFSLTVQRTYIFYVVSLIKRHLFVVVCALCNTNLCFIFVAVIENCSVDCFIFYFSFC